VANVGTCAAIDGKALTVCARTLSQPFLGGQSCQAASRQDAMNARRSRLLDNRPTPLPPKSTE
jgi:hypothetical protein